MDDPVAFLGHIEAARPLLSSIEAEPALLSSAECTFIAQWICTLYPIASQAIDEPPAPASASQKAGGPLATLTNTNNLQRTTASKAPADKRRKSMLPAPRKSMLPPAVGAVAAHHPAAPAAAAAAAHAAGKTGPGKTGSNVVSGFQLRPLERGESGVGATSVMEQLRSALVANLGRVSDLFREWDVDGSGSVSKAEFHKALTKLGLKASKAECGAIFDMLDEDLSGSIEYRELHARLRRGGRADNGGNVGLGGAATALTPAAAEKENHEVASEPRRRPIGRPIGTSPSAAPSAEPEQSPVAVVASAVAAPTACEPEPATPAAPPAASAAGRQMAPAGVKEEPQPIAAPSKFGTLDFAQHFAAPRFEHPEGSISGSPIIDEDVTATLLDVSAAAKAAYAAGRVFDGMEKEEEGQDKEDEEGVEYEQQQQEEEAEEEENLYQEDGIEGYAPIPETLTMPLASASADHEMASVFNLPGTEQMASAEDGTAQLTSPSKPGQSHQRSNRRGSQASFSTISTPSLGDSPPKSIGKILMSSSRGYRGRRYVYDQAVTPELDDTHMFSNCEAGPTPELRSPPKSLRKQAERLSAAAARSGAASRSGGVGLSGGGGRSGDSALSGRIPSRSSAVGRLSMPRTAASWAAALDDTAGATPSATDDDDDENFVDALESPPVTAVPPPAWEVGPSTPLSGHQLRLTPARLERSSRKVAGSRSLGEACDAGSYEAQWISSAKKSSARRKSARKSCLKSTSKYSPVPAERVTAAATSGSGGEDADGADDASEGTVWEEEEVDGEDSTRVVASKGADAMAAILEADDTITIAHAAAMVPNVTLSDILPIANTPSKQPRQRISPAEEGREEGERGRVRLEHPPLDLGLFPVSFQKGRAAEQLTALYDVMREAAGPLNANELQYLLQSRGADAKLDLKRISLLLEVLHSRKAILFEGHGALRCWALPG